MKHKIFVSSYACEPGLGSEIGVGWHWVLEMSRYFDLWVLTRRSNKATIENWLQSAKAKEEDEERQMHDEGLVSDIKWIYFDLPDWARKWKRGMRGVRTYYNIWQKLVNKLVKQTMKENDIHTFHHLTYGNAMWPVSSYGSRAKTFIWGPIGGFETIPVEFSQHYDKRQRYVELIRRCAASVIKNSMSLKRRCKRADLILCKTDITLQAMPTTKGKVIHFTDVAPDNNAKIAKVKRASSSTLQLIAVGRLDAWRGFDLAIEALGKARERGIDAILTIVGSGPDKTRLKQLVADKKLEKSVIFTGKLSMDEYYSEMSKADIVVNPALKEGAVTVSFDSMALGKPLIAVDSTGYTKYFSPEYSILIPITSRTEVINRLADGIYRLSDSDLRSRMGNLARVASTKYNWRVHGEEIRDAINSVIGDEG